MGDEGSMTDVGVGSGIQAFCGARSVIADSGDTDPGVYWLGGAPKGCHGACGSGAGLGLRPGLCERLAWAGLCLAGVDAGNGLGEDDGLGDSDGHGAEPRRAGLCGSDGDAAETGLCGVVEAERRGPCGAGTGVA